MGLLKSNHKIMTVFDASAFLASCSQHPGVYRMFDANDQLLYVGKAKNLKNRLSSYFKTQQLAPKTAALVKKIARIAVTLTHNETEALLLEQTLIKQSRPPYNILLRDDKSYPYVLLSNDPFPRLSIHLGKKKPQGEIFGPYPSRVAIRESLNLLQKTFQVRQCDNTFFKNRSRPCLQYQIKRCKAPCVGLVEADEYAQDVRHSKLFLTGRSHALTDELKNHMEQAAKQLDFEQAAVIRDQISALRRVQDQQSMEGGHGNVDVIALASNAGVASVHLIKVRDGRVLGSKNYYPKLALESTDSEILTAFIAQLYLTGAERDLPNTLITNLALDDRTALTEALSAEHQKKIELLHTVRGNRLRWLQLAQTNAEHALQTQLADKSQIADRFDKLTQALQLNSTPERLECFDISHSSGEATVASCVVFGPEGPLKSDYRLYNIEGVTAGDDYAAMQQALERRLAKASKQADAKLPDLLIVDGGKGQLQMAKAVLNELALNDITLLGIAKGVTRKPGLETLYLNSIEHEFTLPSHSPALHLIQHIRDEAHRFAITGHRARRGKARRTSPLEGIPNVGPKRRRELLKQFGGLQELSRASIEEISKTPGISRTLAETIYAALHSH